MRVIQHLRILLLGSAALVGFINVAGAWAEDAKPVQADQKIKPSAKAKAKAKPAAKPQPQAEQAKPAAKTQAAADANAPSSLGLQEIVVTGNSTKTEKFKAAYAVSTQNQQDIQEKQPRSVVDLFRSLPGVTVENSGGEGGGENVTIRGLPFAGFRLLDVQEDGLPLFHSNYERQMNADELFRVDLNTTRAEIVRGGTAPIYSDNASGGAINFITNHGTETQQNAVKLSTGSAGLFRSEFESSGPITPNLLYSASGFFRRDDGQRNPGFPNADIGGQGKVAMTYLGDAGKIWADYKYLNDRTIFYSAIPLSNPITGASLNGLINQNFGTLDSGSFNHVNFLTLNGAGGVTSVNRNLSDGVHPQTRTLSAGGDFDLGDGWGIHDKARFVGGSVGFDAILNGAPADATANLNGFLSGAQKAFAGTTGLQYVYAGTNTVYNPATTGGLTMLNTWSSSRINYQNFVNDFNVTKEVDSPIFGHHDFTGGIAVSVYKFDEQVLNNTLLTNVKDRPDALDIQALNASGNVIGNVSQNGFTAYTTNLSGRVNGVTPSIYGADTWHITKEWSIDAGFRHEMEFDNGTRGVIGNQTISTTGPLVGQTVNGVIGYAPYSKALIGTSETIGTSYQFNENVNTWARYTNTYSFPRLSDQWGNINNGVAGTLPNGQPVPTTPIQQAEIGGKLLLPGVQLALIGFYSHFDKLNASTFVANTTTGILANSPLLINTTTKGLEFEGAWRISKEFNLKGAATIQDPRIDSATTFSSTISGAALANKYIPRAPVYQFSIEPSYNFEINDVRGSLFADIYIEGQRYQDFTNTSILTPFATLDVGTKIKLTNNIDFEFLATNLTNSTGLTEGNARAPSANVITVADATVGRPVFGRAFTLSTTIHW